MQISEKCIESTEEMITNFEAKVSQFELDIQNKARLDLVLH